MTLEEIVSKIKGYMIFKEDKPIIIDLILAIALSMDLDKPVWIMIIAPPSSGKTELSEILKKTKRVHFIPGLTEKALFSGHTSAQGGYMKREVKKKGILIFPDFTTVLSNDSKTKKKIFNQLRTIFDGSSARLTGMDTGKAKLWKGKVAVIALVTESIDQEIEMSSDLGERFLYFRYNPKEITPAELSKFNRRMEAKDDVQILVSKFLDEKKNLLTDIKLSDNENNTLYKLSKFLSLGRAKVKRSGYSREVVQIHKPESVFRIITALTNLYKSLLCVNNDRTRSMIIIKRIVLDSIPNLRFKIIKAISTAKLLKPTYELIRINIEGISDSKVRRTIEDMCLQKMIVEKETGSKNSKYYSFTKEFIELMQAFKN